MAPPKLSLRQKRMKSRLNEVEKNFINSTTDADFARNSKLLQSLRAKAKEMGLTTRTDNQLFESMDTTRKDKLKRGKLAGYSKGVYNPKTKKREFASAVDDPNRYDIVDFGEHLSYLSLGVSGAGLAIKIAKNPKLILELPKNVQAGVRAAYNKLKGTKPMASKKIASLTQKAIFGKSLLTDKAFKAFQDLPDAVQKKIIPQITSGNVRGLRAIEEAAQKAQKTLGKASETTQVRKGREALEKAGKPPKTKTKTEAPKTEAPKTKTKTDNRASRANEVKKVKKSKTAKPENKQTTAVTKTDNNQIPTNRSLVPVGQRSLVASGKKKIKSGSPLTEKEKLALAVAGITFTGTAAALSGKGNLEVSQVNAATKSTKPAPKDKKPTGEMNAPMKSKKDEIGTEDPSSAPTEKKTKKKTKISDSGGREDAKVKNKTPKRKPLEQGKRKIKTDFGTITVDSTDKGMSKFSGFDNREELEAEEEMNFRKGGMAKYKKGGMAFGKGGMYKAPKKTYGMRYGGFTRRGMGK